MWIIILLIILIVIGALLFLIGHVFYSVCLHMKNDKQYLTGPIIMDQRTREYENIFIQYDPKDVYLTNRQGLKLHGIKVDQKSSKWVVLMHGYMGRNGELVDVADFFLEEGYNVLSLSQRAHNKSEGDAISMGYYESDDLVDWINDLVKDDPDCSIVLFGVSMGAATVMMSLGKNLPSNVKTCIEDCGYTSAWDEFSYQLNQNTHLPPFPIIHIADLITKMRGGFRFKEANPLRAVQHSNIPTLFIHGTNDLFVPTYMVYKLYHFANYPKQLLLIEGGEHAIARYKDPELYFTTIRKWIASYCA
ncbi:hypothetical protein C815_01150 [Firmicutes bacterium M10-2]|nr:hypothetical protein C815_01150 [Firmicutes bacterium M10-2]